MKITFVSMILGIFLLSGIASATSITPNSWSLGSVSPGSSHTTTFTIFCDTNTTCDLSADTDWITFSKTHFEAESTSFKATLTIPDDVSLGDYTKHIKLNDVSTVIITFTVTKGETSGHLEPSFSTLITSIEQDTETSRILTIRNMYPDKIEVIGISSIGTIITQEGIRKPVDIEGELGWLQAGQDLVLTVKINTVGIDTGKYTPKFDIAYYYNGERRTTTINFEINVIKKLSPGGGESQILKQMVLDVSPENPYPSEQVSIDVRDESGNDISDANILVEVYENDTKLSDFIYYSPFTVESGKKYCINVTKDGYDSVKKCFLVGFISTKIKISPENPQPNETVLIQYVTSNGNIVRNGKIEINGKVYDGSQLSKKFQSGEYIIKAYKNGYKTTITKLIVKEKFKIINLPQELSVGHVLTAKFNREADWKLFKNGENGASALIRSGTSDGFNITLNQIGNYTLDVEGYQIPIKVTGFNLNFLNKIPLTEVVILIIVVLVVYFGYKKLKTKKKSSKHDIGFYPNFRSPIEEASGLKKKESEE